MKNLRVMWSIQSALAAHDRQARGTVVNRLSIGDRSDCKVRRGNSVVLIDGPDAGRVATVIGWEKKNASVRLRFEEREAVVPIGWVQECA